MKQKAILIDLDGTLCDVSHRLSHIEKKPKDWDAFHRSCLNDKLNIWCAEIIKKFKMDGLAILLITGRDDTYESETRTWLKTNEVPFDQLFMRPIGNRLSDEVLKAGIYRDFIQEDYNILFVVEDRLRVVRMWRDLGLVCLQCDWGDF